MFALLAYDGNTRMVFKLSGRKMNFLITMGNKAKCTPAGRGIVVFQTEAGERLRATNLLHVLGFGMNLLYVSQLQNKGYDVFFRKYMSNTQVGIGRPRLESEVTGCIDYN